MNPEAKIVKSLIKEIVDGTCKNRLYESINSPEVNWKKLQYSLSYNELAPFLYIIAKERGSLLPDIFFDYLKRNYYLCLSRYMILQDELLNILRKAKKENVLILPIKGFSYPEDYYKRFGFRPLVDIDLLIREENFKKGQSLLEDLGYRKYLLEGNEDYWQKEQCHLEFMKKIENDFIPAELHWALDFKRHKEEVIPDLWKRLKEIKFDNEEFFALSPEDTLFSLALHQRRFGKVFNLKYISDAGMILEKENLDWDYIYKTAYAGKIRVSLYFLLYQAQFVLDKDLEKYLSKLKMPLWHRKLISKIVKRYIYSPPDMSNLSYVYLICHLLLYDNITYPVKYAINIPIEQFAKFFSLPIYADKTAKLYRIRFFYFFYKLIKKVLCNFIT